jgi:SAM-dependent methyltransferase
MTDPNDHDRFIDANREAWDQSAPLHRTGPDWAPLLDGFRTPGFSCLDEIATARLTAIGIDGRAVAQICCNNGREILSIKNLGAGRCVGFDQSAAFLAQARELAAAGAIDCTFVEGDAYRIDAAYDGAFERVVITIGVFGWMPDLQGFLKVAARLLAPDGVLCIYEQHPIMQMMEPWDEPDPARLTHSYFKGEPFIDEGPILYDDAEKPRTGGAVQYWFPHKLSDILTACLTAGLTIEAFEEFPHNISAASFELYTDQPAQPPQSYWLTARKTAGAL